MKILFILLFGFAGLALFHSGEMGSQFQQMMGDRIDIRFCAFINEHLFQVLRGKAEFLSPAIFFPYKGSLGYSDVFLLHFLAYAPLRAFIENPLTALQLAVITLNFLTYVTTFLFLNRGLRTSAAAATLGAIFFAFNSAKFNQLNHIQLQPLFLLPLMTWVLWWFVKDLASQSGRDVFKKLSLAGLLLNIQLLTAVYVAWYYGFLILLIFSLLLAISKEKRLQFKSLFINHQRSLALAASTFVVGLIPFLLIYIPIVMETGTRVYGEVKPMIPRWQSLFWMDSTNYVWGWLANTFPSFYRLPLHWEHRIGLGAIITLGVPAAAIYLLRKLRRSKADEQQMYVWPAVLAGAVMAYYLLGMTYWNNHSPWWVVFKYIPGASSIRAVARYALVTALPISILLALFIDTAWKKILLQSNSQKFILIPALCLGVGFLLVEQFGRQVTFSKMAEYDRARMLSARLDPTCDNFFITLQSKQPEFMAEVQGEALAVSMLTGKPTLNGYSGLSPKEWPLWDIAAPDYLKNVEKWRIEQGILGKTCALAVDYP